MSRSVTLTATPFDAVDELKAFNVAATGAGAVVSFTGLVRGTTREGAPVMVLVLESHRTLTLQSMEDIAAAAQARFTISQSRVIHREGRILPGEPIVFVATASPNRRAALQAADYIMDRLKSEAVLWKREVGPAGSDWIEPTADDSADLERWHDDGRSHSE